MLLENFARLTRADKLYRQPVSLLSKLIVQFTGLYGIGQGVVVLLTSDVRWGSPSYSVARQIMPPQGWATISIIFGLLIIGGSWRREHYVRLLGHIGLAAWTAVFSVCTALAMTDRRAGNLGPGVFLFAALVIAAMSCVDEGTPARDFYGKESN